MESFDDWMENVWGMRTVLFIHVSAIHWQKIRDYTEMEAVMPDELHCCIMVDMSISTVLTVIKYC
jgi:hypothetical protein